MSCSGSSTLSTYAGMSVTSTAYSSSHSCVGVPGGGGGGGVPVESRPRDVGQVVLEGRPVLGRPFAGFAGGVVAPQGVGQVRPGRPLAGGGGGGGVLCELGSAGSARCGLELRRGEVDMMLRVLCVLELQL